MDILTLFVMLAAIALYEELLNGKYKLSAKLLEWLEKKTSRTAKKSKS